MPGNLVQVGSNNKVRVNGNKVVVGGASDPCCCEEAECDACGGPAPGEYTVTFEDVVMVTCFACGGQVGGIESGTLNGTYCLTLSETSCTWESPVLDIVWRSYDGGDVTCTGTPLGATDFFVRLTRGLFNIWTLEVIRSSGANVRLFVGQKSEADCETPFEVTNQHDSLLSCFPTEGAYDGTATVTPGC